MGLSRWGERGVLLAAAAADFCMNKEEDKKKKKELVEEFGLVERNGDVCGAEGMKICIHSI